MERENDMKSAIEDRPVSVAEPAQPTETKMREFLRVKIKSLAAEARIIRHEERKVKARRREPGEEPDTLFFDLQRHRKIDVRREARSALLAYGFIRGTTYVAMEVKPHTKPDWKRVQKMVERFCGLGHNEIKFVKNQIAEWAEAAPKK